MVVLCGMSCWLGVVGVFVDDAVPGLENVPLGEENQQSKQKLWILELQRKYMLGTWWQ